MNKKLKAWYKATNAIAQEFCDKYFDGTLDWRWIGDEVGGNFEVADCFFGLNRMVEALEINCSYELLRQFYEYEIECYQNETRPEYNFKNWVRYFAGFNGKE